LNAITVLGDSLAICRELGDRMDEAVSLHNLGRVDNGLEQCQKAIAYHQDSLGLFREMSDPIDRVLSTAEDCRETEGGWEPEGPRHEGVHL
jgi:Tetratricopeptide repeat